jgi:uncharacterized protein (DUF1697 family)
MPSTELAPLHVALLRGINVSGKNTLPMAELASIFVEAGCEEVRTYIQSGNVVFRANASVARRVPEVVAGLIAEGFGYEVPVVCRSASEFRKVAKGHPFSSKAQEHKALHVAFLMSKPSVAKVGSLDPDRSPPDQFTVRGREIYLHCPNGIGRSRLTNKYFDSKLGTTSTLRNWKTVLRLAGMLDG